MTEAEKSIYFMTMIVNHTHISLLTTYDSKSSTLIINYDDDDTDKYTININGNTMTAKNEYGTETTFKKK